MWNERGGSFGSGKWDPDSVASMFNRTEATISTIESAGMVLAHLPYNVLVGVDHCKRTLLHRAAAGKSGALSESMVRAMLLRMNNADVNAKSTRGWTALHYAARDGHTKICTIIMQSMKSETLTPSDIFLRGYTSWHLALESSACSVVFISTTLGYLG